MLGSIKQHFAYRPREGQLWDWHKWLHLRWWKIWLTTEKCACGARRPYSLMEVTCVFCLRTNFGYDEWTNEAKWARRVA